MKIVIVGAGEVGGYLCGQLSGRSHAVTVIEQDEGWARRTDESYDAKVVVDNGSSAEVLDQAGVRECDFFLAMTSDDRTNLISSSLAKAMGAETTIARVHDQTYSDNSYVNYQLHFGIDHLINPEALCAIELAKAIRTPGTVAVEQFSRGQVEAHRFTVRAGSSLTGKSLRQLSLDPSVRIGLIVRGDTVEVPTAQTIFEANDRVTVFGTPQSLGKLHRRFDPTTEKEPVRVVLSGGSEIAIALVRLLSHPRFRVRIIESQAEVCRRLAEKFLNVNVIHGDATSLRVLEEEQIGNADFFISCSKKDEDNITTGMQAAELGAPHVQVVINKTDYEVLISRLKSRLGFELSVSPRTAAAREVLRYFSEEPVTELAALPNKAGNVLEMRVSRDNRYAGKPLRQLPLPDGCVLVALLHKFQAKVPGAEDTLLGGDRVVVVAKEGNVSELRKLLGSG